MSDLDQESDRGMILSASCMLELQIERCVEAWFCKGPNDTSKRLTRTDGPLGGFAARIDLLSCLGGIDDFESAALHRIRKIRNAFAHNLMASFSTPSISDRSIDLAKHVLQEIDHSTLDLLVDQGPRRCFTASVFILVDILGLRPMLISQMSEALNHDFAEISRKVETIIDEVDEGEK